jgi:hypothetical protein
MTAKIAIHAKDATIPISSKNLTSKEQVLTPDFLKDMIEKGVNQASCKQRKEWKKQAKQYIRTFENTMRRVSPSLLAVAPTLLVDPSSPAITPIPGLNQLITIFGTVLSSVFASKIPEIPHPRNLASVAVPLVPPITSTAPAIPQAATQAQAVQQTTVNIPLHKHTLESIIPKPAFGQSPADVDFASMFQAAIHFLIHNGFWFLVAIFVSSFIVKALGFDALAKKMAKNTLRGLRILLLALPVLTLITYVICWLISGIPGGVSPLG